MLQHQVWKIRARRTWTSGPRKLPLMSATAVEGRARMSASRLDRRVGSGCVCCGNRVARAALDSHLRGVPGLRAHTLRQASSGWLSKNEFGVHFNFAGIPGRDHAPGLCTVAFVLFAIFPRCSLPWIWVPGLHQRLPGHPIPSAPMACMVSPSRLSLYFRSTGSVTAFAIQERKQFIVTCKRCRLDIPAGVKVFPFQSIIIACPLCGEQLRYWPSEVLLGRPHPPVEKQARAGAP